jgi:tetratricopeptide (TPR) repeat protein
MTRTIALAAVLLAALVARGPRVEAQRFDNEVRADFFAGLAGNQERFETAMQRCEAALAMNANDAPALVWHGGGLLVRSGELFRAGRIDDGIALRSRGLDEMNRAVALRPDDVEVLIPRATTLAAIAAFTPAAQAESMLRAAAADFEKVLAVQAPVFGSAPVHSRGELLGGLANAYRLLGDRARAETYLRRLVSELPGTPYERKASAWLADLPGVTRQDRFCLGCHAPAR